LAKHFAIDLSSHLTGEQRAAARAIQIMIEEHLYWYISYFNTTALAFNFKFWNLKGRFTLEMGLH